MITGGVGIPSALRGELRRLADKSGTTSELLVNGQESEPGCSFERYRLFPATVDRCRGFAKTVYSFPYERLGQRRWAAKLNCASLAYVCPAGIVECLCRCVGLPESRNKSPKSWTYAFLFDGNRL